MLYEAMAIAGGSYLTASLLMEQWTKDDEKKLKEERKERIEKKLAPPKKKELTYDQKWDYFIRVKKAHKKHMGSALEKEIEQDLIKAEKAIQDKNKGFYFGTAVNLGLEPGKAKLEPLFFKWSNLYNHYIIFGTTRFGKTRALANHMRQFIDAGYNVFVIDPKGGEKHEILGWACEFANEAGRLDDLMFMNPVFPTLTDCFNPIFNKTNNEVAAELKLYAQGSSQNANDFFTLRVPQIINAIGTACEYMEKARDPEGVLTAAEIEKEVRNYVVNRITNGHKISFADKETMIMNPDLATRAQGRISDMPKRTEGGAYLRKLMTYKDFAYYSEYTNLLALKENVVSTPLPAGISEERIKELELLRDEAKALLVGAMGPNEDQYMKTTGTLLELLTKLSTGSIGRMFCSVPINPIQLRLESEDKGLICIVQPSPLKYQSVSEMIMKIFLKTLESTYGNVAATGRLFKRRTIVIIDEASKALFPGIEELFNKLGGLGLSFGLYTQSQADLVQMLGRETATVIRDNINTVGYMKTNDLESRAKASDDFGESKIVDYQMQMQGGVGGAGRGGVSTELQAIAHKDSFDELQIGECLVKHYGKRYFVEFPYQVAPSAYMIMPDLEAEKTTREMIELQNMFQEEMFKRAKPSEVEAQEELAEPIGA